MNIVDLKEFFQKYQSPDYGVFVPEFMTVDEMISHVKNNKEHFRCYFEAIVDKDGNVALAVPSHQKRIIQFYEELGGDINDIPIEYSPELWIAQKYGICITWYDRVRIPVSSSAATGTSHIDPVVGNTFKKLSEAGIININTVIPNNEYEIYLSRESEKGAYLKEEKI